MPFTFSHPAIILPLNYLPRRWLSLTGLVIGSLTPDFEYFFRMRLKSEYSHSLEGLFYFDLPLGIFLAFVFHLIVRNILINNSPHFLRKRFAQFETFNWKAHFKEYWLVIFFSVLFGAGSHIIWDGFTHSSGYFVQRLPVLSSEISFLGCVIPGYRVLQHGSSIIGMIVIAYAVYQLPKLDVGHRKMSTQYWLVLSGITLVIFFGRYLLCPDKNQIGHLVVSFISAGFIALIITSLWQRWIKKS